jgi:hypothetical protein
METTGDARIYNNIIANAPGDQTPVAVCNGDDTRYYANDVYNGTEAPFRWCVNVGNRSVDPQLGADFTLPAGSPLLDAGDDDPIAPLLPPADAGGSPRVTDGNGLRLSTGRRRASRDHRLRDGARGLEGDTHGHRHQHGLGVAPLRERRGRRKR